MTTSVNNKFEASINDLYNKGSIENSSERLKLCAESGFLKHTIPTEFGGYGNRFLDLCKSHEELGAICIDPGLILSLNAHLWGSIYAILLYGSDTQKNYYLRMLVNGELIGGHAITEPEAGSDAKAMTSEVIETNHSYILNGKKRYITNAPIADVMTVYVKDSKGLSAFLLHSNDSGSQFYESHNVLGCASSPIGEIVMNNCEIPKDRLLGTANTGSIMIQRILELERAFIFAGIIGVMKKQFEFTLEYTKKRKSNGKSIHQNQAVSHKLVEMQQRIDTTRLWVHNCAMLKDQNMRISLESAQTKYYAAEAFLQTSLDASYLLGAYGLETDQPAAYSVYDAMASKLFSGTSEIQKNIIASMIGAY